MKPGKATIDAFAPFVFAHKSGALQDVKNIEERIKRHTETVADFKSSIQTYRDRLTREGERIKAERVRLREYTKKYNAIKVSARRVRMEMDRLKRHHDVLRVSIVKMGDGFGVKIITQPLFTDIQIDENTKEKRRAFLGVFEIRLNDNPRDIRVKNLSFPRSRAHWSVGSSQNAQACLGDWGETFEQCRKSGNWSLFMTTLGQYLRSTEDGSAYDRAYRWRDNRTVSGILYGATSTTYYYRTGHYYLPDAYGNNTVMKNVENILCKYEQDDHINYLVLENGDRVHTGYCYTSSHEPYLPIAVDTLATCDEVKAFMETYMPPPGDEYYLSIVDSLTDSEAREAIGVLSKELHATQLSNLVKI